MITLKSPNEITKMQESGAILGNIHWQLRDFIQPGVTTNQIDRFVHEKIIAASGIPPKLVLKGMSMLLALVLMMKSVTVSQMITA